MSTKCYYCKQEIADDDISVKQITPKTKRMFHKSKDCYNKYLFERYEKCLHCKKKILYDSDYVEYGDGYLHCDCIDDFVTKRKEIDDFKKCYDYLKTNILKYRSDMSLSPSQVNRLRGLRDGKQGLRRGEKQQYSGYPFNIIYLTLVYKTPDIEKALATKVFQNEDRKTDYIIAIVANSINDVYEKLLEKEKSETRLTKAVENVEKENKIEVKANQDHKAKSSINKKILDILNQETDDLGI